MTRLPYIARMRLMQVSEFLLASGWTCEGPPEDRLFNPPPDMREAIAREVGHGALAIDLAARAVVRADVLLLDRLDLAEKGVGR